MQTRTFSARIHRVFLSEPTSQEILRSIETGLHGLASSYCGGFEERKVLSIPPAKATLLEITNTRLKNIIIVSAVRAIDLADGLIASANEKRFSICALVTGSLIELAATLCWLREQLQPYLNGSFFDREQLETVQMAIEKTLFGGHYDFALVWSDPKRAIEQEEYKRPPDKRLPGFTGSKGLMECLDKVSLEMGISKRKGAVKKRYSALSSFVHALDGALLTYHDSEVGILRLRPNQENFLLHETVLPAAGALVIVKEMLVSLNRALPHFARHDSKP